MIRVQIGTFDYDLKDISEDELIKQIKGRRDDGVPLCIKVTIKSGNLNLVLTTPDCQGGNGGRPPTVQEKDLFDLWGKMKLDTNDFAPGNLMGFLKQVQNLC